MPDKGVNSTFKKIIYESSEMVFLADDTYPYTIFYGNELFEKEIGDDLEQRNLVGLGLDVNSYIFKEELVLSHHGQDYSFSLELPHENDSNYFLFYKGKQIESDELPTKSESIDYFRTSPQSIAIGEYDFLTFLNSTALERLGYDLKELVNTSLDPFIHPDDLERVNKIWKKAKKKERSVQFDFRFKKKSEDYEKMEVILSFSGQRFFISTVQSPENFVGDDLSLAQDGLVSATEDLTEIGRWRYHLREGVLRLDSVAESILKMPSDLQLSGKKLKKDSKSLVKKLDKKINRLFQEAGTQSISYVNSEDQTYLLKWNENSISKENGVIAGIIWINDEIEQKNEERSFFKSLFMDSPEAMILIERTGEISMLNNEAISLFELKSQNYPKHIDDFAEFLVEGESIDDWTANKEESKVERISRIRNTNEDILTLAIRSKEINSGSKTFISISFRNITEKITLERSLEDSTEFLMNLTDQVPGGLYQMVLSNDGNIRFDFLSKGIGTVLGLESGQVESIRDIGAAMANVHPEDLPQVVMTSVSSAKRMEPWQCQFRVKSGNTNGFHWVMGEARPQRHENGEMAWYGYLADISRQKEFEERLDDAKQAAEKANQIKSDFLSMISHELRTPLNAISGSVYSLLHESPSDYQKNALNTINFAVDNLIIMINDLLDFQKIEAGKLNIENAGFNLSDLLNQIVKGLTFHARDSKNKLSLELDPKLDVMVLGDKTRISQVLNNLITNALKFTHKGMVSVKVDLLKKKSNKIRVYFEVQDTGIGIAKENQEKIFEDFDQVKPTFNKKYGGTGLGLSITKKLLNIMGSEIHLESELDEGSKFYFELDLELDKGSSIPEIIPSTPHRLTEDLHLLMAEDNEVNALVLGKIIKKWGYTHDRVVNGQEAVDALNSDKKYDCILMDIQMPVMDGFEATELIKKESEIPVIALTAAAKLEIMERIKECGFDAFVAKPIDAAELHAAIKEVVVKFHSRA